MAELRYIGPGTETARRLREYERAVFLAEWLGKRLPRAAVLLRSRKTAPATIQAAEEFTLTPNVPDQPQNRREVNHE